MLTRTADKQPGERLLLWAHAIFGRPWKAPQPFQQSSCHFSARRTDVAHDVSSFDIIEWDMHGAKGEVTRRQTEQTTYNLHRRAIQFHL